MSIKAVEAKVSGDEQTTLEQCCLSNWYGHEMITSEVSQIAIDGQAEIKAFPSVAVIVRTHNIARLHLVRRAVFSLCVQARVCIELCVATQNFSETDVRALSHALALILQVPGAIQKAFVLNVCSPQSSDLRAELLNLGVAATSARYLAFLDDDDLLYHYCYSKLIEDLTVAGAAIAFGRCVRVFGEQKGDIFYSFSKDRPYEGGSIIELIAYNFCPIHSYVIDRKIVKAEDLQFDQISPFFEDYRFLLKLIPKYTFIFLSMAQDVCEYWFFNNNTNSTGNLSNRLSVKSDAYRKGYLETERLKTELCLQVKFLDLELWFKTRGTRAKSWPISDGLISHTHLVLDDIKLAREAIFGDEQWETR